MSSLVLMTTTHRGSEAQRYLLEFSSVPRCLGVTYSVVYGRR